MKKYKDKLSIIDINLFIMIIIIYVYNFQTLNKGNIFTNLIILEFSLVQWLKMFKSKKFKIDKTVLFLLLFDLFAFLSFFWSIYQSHTLGKAVTVFYNLIFLCSLLWYLNSESNIRKMIKAIIVAGVIASLYSIFNSSFIDGNRVSDIIGNANTVAIYLSYSAALAFYYYNTSNLKLLNIIAYLIICFAILITGSRGGLFLLTVFTIYINIVFGKKEKKDIVKQIIKIFMLFFLIILLYKLTQTNKLLYSIVGIRIKSLFEIIGGHQSSIAEKSTYDRLAMIKLAFDIFLKHPIQGCGLGAIGVYIKYYITGFFCFCHNNYMELLSGVGLIGFTLYYSIHINILKKFRQIRIKYKKIPDLAKIGKVLIIGLLISHLFIVHYYYKLEYVLLSLIISICDYYMKKEKANE